MSYMFYGCSSLSSLDDISKWNIDNVNDISFMFYICPLLSDSEKILNIFYQRNYILKEKGEKRMKEEEEKKGIEDKEKIILKKKKEMIIQKQVEFRNKKISDEKVKGVLEDMCILGNIMKKEIIEEKKNMPEKFISIKEATKMENKDKDIFCLGVLAQTLENIGITTAIEKNELNNLESQKASNTILEFIMNGMIEKKNMIFILI